MSFPWRGMFYDCPITMGAPDAYYVPGTAIVRTPEVPEPIAESAPLGAFTPEGEWVPGPPGPGLVPAPWCPARAAWSGFGQDTATEGSSAGKWVVGVSLGLSVALFVGTLMLRPGKG